MVNKIPNAVQMGSKGGKQQTPAQTEARRENMAKALAARLAKRKEVTEKGHEK